jgi:ketosteroid isomerase-like protein
MPAGTGAEHATGFDGGGIVDRKEAERFARTWVDAWNRRDAEAVLATYADDLSFTSPTAHDVVGQPTVRGKDALRDYWRAALGRITSLRFTLDRIVWDGDARELGIVYTSDTNGSVKRVMELFRFGEDGLVRSTEVMHGRVPG